NESTLFRRMEKSSMSRSFLGTLAEQAKRTETKILSAGHPASNRFIPAEDVDLNIIIYMSK
ncbi:MAG: hypothetical protein ABII26_02390, partial [Pseudomonadota bacterium]